MRTAPKVWVNGLPVYLCSRECVPKLKATPATYIKHSLQDPVSEKWFKPTATSPKMEWKGALYLFSSETTHAAFQREPGRYAR